MLQEEALANYRGHVGFLLCVDWSPTDPDVIWTGGKDFTVQEWKISKQEHTRPPKGERLLLQLLLLPRLETKNNNNNNVVFNIIVRLLSVLIGKKMVDLKEKMKANPKLKKKNKKASGATTPEVNGDMTAGGERVVSALGGRPPSEEEEEEVVTSTNGPVPQPGNPAETEESIMSCLFLTLDQSLILCPHILLQQLWKRRGNRPQLQRAETRLVRLSQSFLSVLSVCPSLLSVCPSLPPCSLSLHGVTDRVFLCPTLRLVGIVLPEEEEASLHVAPQHLHGPPAQRRAAAGLSHSGLHQPPAG